MIRRLATCLAALALSSEAMSSEVPRFNTDILPILSDNCLACHGFDESHRKADLRLDTREGATAVNEGIAAIVPGKPEQSELLTRIVSSDPDEVMPPPKSHKKKLTAEQVDLLKRWIVAGAPWGKHWAFEKPIRPEVPASASHPIDGLIDARLAKKGLKRSPEAARHTLIRRVSLDLTGLPPTPDEVAAFLSDRGTDAYERLVDRLLASPHFGERMAMWWLDAARYADTDGFQGDDTRTNWPWRDWVVAAFNGNKPFDQFTIEQFAGDLLPGATTEQKLATCFHRNHMTNGEGGRDPEESRVDYVIDRVNTTGTLWLGLTLGCAQCHSHKFDPITQADYYSLNAFFNSIDEDGKAGKSAKPYLPFESPFTSRSITEAQRLVDERKPVEAAARLQAEAPFSEWLIAQMKELKEGFSAWKPLHGRWESSDGTVLVEESDRIIQASGPNPKQDDYRVIGSTPLPRIAGLRLEVLPHPSHTGGGLSRGEKGEFTLTDIKLQVRRKGSAQVREIALSNAIADAEADPKKNDGYGLVKHTLDDDPRNGWSTRGHDPQHPRVAIFSLAEPLTLAADEELIFEMRHRSTLGDANIGRFRISATAERGLALTKLGSTPLERLAAGGFKEQSSIPADLRTDLLELFLADHAPYQIARNSLDRANRQLAEAKAAKKVDVMVLAERRQPRDTFVLKRGVWDQHGDKVIPNVPASIATWPIDQPRDRLGLAKWIVSSENPLTARVMVNHLWQLCFGAGLVRTPEDFGLQGERPDYPEVLDWLAVEFVERNWDVKHILKLLVTSATYRQTSSVSEELRNRDPENRLLARGARFRLPSWMLRDSALRSAGLLNAALGGPPVRPYQPDGVWEEMFMGRFKYEPSEGTAQYRRTLYAFWRRAIAPTFLFDSAQRRVCEVRQARTNTPLQALTLLNDVTFLEASRAIALSALSGSAHTDARISTMSQRVLSRDPSEKELPVLKRELKRALTHYKTHPDQAAMLTSLGRPQVGLAPSAELAAHMLVASMLLNLDEAISHE